MTREERRMNCERERARKALDALEQLALYVANNVSSDLNLAVSVVADEPAVKHALQVIADGRWVSMGRLDYLDALNGIKNRFLEK